MEDRSSAQGRRITFWVTFAGPVAFGVMAGVVKLFLPWLSLEGASVPSGERFWVPVLSGVSVAVVLQIGRGWFHARAGDRQGEAVKTLCAVALLVVQFAAGLVALVKPDVLVMFLPLLIFVGFLLWWPRKHTVPPRDRDLGLYCGCILCIIVSAVSLSMALTPTT